MSTDSKYTSLCRNSGDQRSYTSICRNSSDPRSFANFVKEHAILNMGTMFENPKPACIAGRIGDDTTLGNIKRWITFDRVHFTDFGENSDDRIDLSEIKKLYPTVDCVIFSGCRFDGTMYPSIKSPEALSCVFSSCVFPPVECIIRASKDSAVIIENPLANILNQIFITVSSDGVGPHVHLSACDHVNECLIINAGLVYARGVLPASLVLYQCTGLVTFNACKDNTTLVSRKLKILFGVSQAIDFSNCELDRTAVSIELCVWNCVMLTNSLVKALFVKYSVLTGITRYSGRGTGCIINGIDSVCRNYKDISTEPATVVSSRSVGFPRKPLVLYKKAHLYTRKWFRTYGDCMRSVIVKLEVPQTADIVYSTYLGKFRVSEAKVVGFFDWDETGTSGDIKSHKLTKARIGFRFGYRHFVVSNRDYTFFYKKNAVVKPTEPFDLSDEACASGIHGFLTFEEAKNY